jgi:hypothetical protein
MQDLQVIPPMWKIVVACLGSDEGKPDNDGIGSE